MKPKFFKSQADFRAWLEKNGATEKELWIGYYKKESGKGGMVYKQALDEALCCGWIDGVVHRIDESSYKQRWTPRTRTSKWSLVNIRRMEELIKQGLVSELGLKVYRERDPKRQTQYLYEQQDVPLAPTYARQLKANARAWTFFEAQPPGYRRLMIKRIMSAKKEETRLKRLGDLISVSAAQKRMELM
jgi:uncharacterized protein YdeI (YjbR/CyaY-like superfamily)